MKLSVLLCSALLLLSVPPLEAETPATCGAPGQEARPEPTEPDCEKYKEFISLRIYDPICGSDGLTYANESVLCYDNRRSKKNVKVACKGPC